MLITIKNIKSAWRRKYIYYLTSVGKIPTYFNDNGDKQYNTSDLKNYKKINRRGRPAKILETMEDNLENE